MRGPPKAREVQQPSPAASKKKGGVSKAELPKSPRTCKAQTTKWSLHVIGVGCIDASRTLPFDDEEPVGIPHTATGLSQTSEHDAKVEVNLEKAAGRDGNMADAVDASSDTAHAAVRQAVVDHGDEIAKNINIGVGQESTPAKANAPTTEDEDDDISKIKQDQAVRDMFAALRTAEADTDDNPPDFVKIQQDTVTVQLGSIFSSMEEASIAARVKSVAPLRKLPGGSLTFGGWCCASRKRASIYNISEGAAVKFAAGADECGALVHVQV